MFLKMKTCPNCNSEVNDDFELCWNCQYSFSEKRIVQNEEFSEVCPNCHIEINSPYNFCPNCRYRLRYKSDSSDSQDGALNLECLRCKVPMIFKGTSKFHEGGPIQNFFEVVNNRELFDLYFCPNCGKVEFFLPLND